MYALCLIPIFVAFILIVKTKRAFESCMAGILTGILIYAWQTGQWDIGTIFYQFLSETCSAPGNMWIIIFSLGVGVVTQVLFDSGATRAFTNWVTAKFANNSKKSLLSIIILGIVVYADEFLKAAVLHSYGKTIGKKNKLPIEVVGMLVIVLCVPLVSWMPMATWSVYFAQQLEDNGLTSAATADFITKVMPVFVYPVILFVIIILFSIGVFPGLGRIREIKKKVENGNYDFGVYDLDQDTVKAESRARPGDFIVPLLILLLLGICYNGDLAIGSLIVVFLELIWFVARKIMTFGEFMDSFWNGMFALFKPTVYLMAGYTFTTIVGLIGFSEMVQTVASVLVPSAVLAFFFVSATAVGAVTGFFWPVTALFLTSCLPVTDALGISPFLLAATLFSAATFGVCISPRGALIMYIGEALHSNPVDLMRYIRPYALIAGGLSFLFYLAVGFVVV